MEKEIKRLYQTILQSEAILIGAGAGLSCAAGFGNDDFRFHKYFQDFIDCYHLKDMYSAGFFPFKTLEEYWAYWSRYIWINRYMDPAFPVYDMLYQLVKDKDYFVLTTNVDHMFQKSGFDKQRLFYMQGDYGLFQCSEPCHNVTYDNYESIRKMKETQHNMRIQNDDIPYCPICHKPMTMNLRIDERFVEDEGWRKHQQLYEAFLRKNENKQMLYLEIGCGLNTPGIIKYNFWNCVSWQPSAIYACINTENAFAPHHIKDRSILLNQDIKEVLSALGNHE